MVPLRQVRVPLSSMASCGVIRLTRSPCAVELVVRLTLLVSVSVIAREAVMGRCFDLRPVAARTQRRAHAVGYGCAVDGAAPESGDDEPPTSDRSAAPDRPAIGVPVPDRPARATGEAYAAARPLRAKGLYWAPAGAQSSWRVPRPRPHTLAVASADCPFRSGRRGALRAFRRPWRRGQSASSSA